MLATQTLIQRKAKNMLVRVDGVLPEGVTAKDIILAIIGEIGTAGGTGYVIEYAGEAIRALSMEGRMTICNMSIEGGARAGLIAPDETTFAYVKDKPRARQGRLVGQGAGILEDAEERRGRAFRQGRRARCGASAADRFLGIFAGGRRLGRRRGAGPRYHPGREQAHLQAARARLYGLTPGTKITDIAIDRVFIGSCTNGRIEDLRAVAKVVEGKKVAPTVDAMIVPGSGLVKAQARPRVWTASSSPPASTGASRLLHVASP